MKELQQELDELKEQLMQQQNRINLLQYKIEQLSGNDLKNGTEAAKYKYEKVSLENFIGLRLIHFIGIIVFVIGLSIGVKYAIDQNLISQGMRIGLAYLAATLLFFFSFRLKVKYVLFSAILFSGSMASLYFTTYAAYVYYQMFSSTIAFVIMVLLTIYTTFQAISYNRQEIALLGLVGAYAIPFLISRNADRPDLFFSYIFIINVAVVYLSVRKTWKSVLHVANIISWILFIGWTYMHFENNSQITSAIFLVLFFFLFLFATSARKIIYGNCLTLKDTYFIIINNIALYIGSLYIFGSGFHHSDIAHITFILFVVAIAQISFIFLSWGDETLMRNMLMNYTLILFSLFVAFEWSGLIVTFLWLLTAVILFFWGVRKKYVPVRMASIILMGATLLKLVAFDSLTFTTIQKIVSYLTLGVLLLFISFYYQKFREQLFGSDTKNHEK